jgi:ribosome-associated protein
MTPRDNVEVSFNSVKVKALSLSKSPRPRKKAEVASETADAPVKSKAAKPKAAAKSAAVAHDPAPHDPLELARLVAQQLDDDKAENILTIPLAGKSPMADAMVVASGRSARHVAAIADHVSRKLKEAGVAQVRVEGLPNADWVLIDAGDVIVHIFRPEVREFYNLERIWSSDVATGHTRAAS